jgi:N-acetylneuraminate 9-O-acetyltransferase
MHEYSREEFRDCLSGRRLVFIGDSTMRQVFWAAVTRLDHIRAEEATLDFFVSDRTKNIRLDVDSVKLEFIWDPWLNSSTLLDQLGSFQRQPNPGANNGDHTDSAALLAIGAPGIWSARHGGEDYMGSFRKGIDAVVPYLRPDLSPYPALSRSRSKQGGGIYERAPNQIFVAPVSVPLYENLSTGRKETITPKRVEALNAYLRTLPAAAQSHIAWSYNEMTRDMTSAFGEDGIHVHDVLAERKIDVLLNARCNAALAQQDQSKKMTCCVPYRMTGIVQDLLLVLGIFSGFVLVWRQAVDYLGSQRHQRPGCTHAMAVLLLAATYCYLTDRSNLFPHTDKAHSSQSFNFALFLFIVLSFLSIPFHVEAEETKSQDIPFLSRSQSDEWKGWMQAVLLLHNYYAEESLLMYKFSRLLYGVYIFLSAYGHTRYFLTTNDFSLRRVAQVLIRLNLLNCLLSFVLDIPITDRMFTLLVSFWFCVIFAGLAILSRFNSNPGILFIKIILMGLASRYLLESPERFKSCFKPAAMIYRMSWDLNMLRFQLSMDNYTPFVGMMAAAFVHRLSVLKQRQHGINMNKPLENVNDGLDRAILDILYPDANTQQILPLIHTFSGFYLVLFSTIAYLSPVLPDREAYDTFHPFTNTFAVMALIILRNCHPKLARARFVLPIALGKLSLEAYIFQYHIWMGREGFDWLQIWPLKVPSSGACYLVSVFHGGLVSFLFLRTCRITNDATQTVSNWIKGGGDAECGRVGPNTNYLTIPVEKNRKRSPARWAPTSHSPQSEGAQKGYLGKLIAIIAGPSGSRLKIFGLVMLIWMGNIMYDA